MKKKKILMVCLGNICRSPLAQGVLSSLLPANEFEVDSAGTAAYHVGEAPDLRSQKIAQQNGIDISKHRGRQVQSTDFECFDYLFVMDKSNYHNLLSRCKTEQQRAKIHFLCDGLAQRKGIELADPYYGDVTDFAQMYQQVKKACEQIAKVLKEA